MKKINLLSNILCFQKKNVLSCLVIKNSLNSTGRVSLLIYLSREIQEIVKIFLKNMQIGKWKTLKIKIEKVKKKERKYIIRQCTHCRHILGENERMFHH